MTRVRLILVACAFLPAVATAEPIALTVGDSLVQTYSENLVTRGWGQTLPASFAGVTWVNRASSGYSSKSFYDQGWWSAALNTKPQWVLVEFGHNDAYAADPARYADAGTTFRDYLRLYITEARAAGATPIVITPVANRVFYGGLIVRNGYLLPYADAMLAVGLEQGVGVVDLYRASLDFYDSLGPSQSQSLCGYSLASGQPDITHLNLYGAQQMARLIVEGLPTASPSLYAHAVPEPSVFVLIGTGIIAVVSFCGRPARNHAWSLFCHHANRRT